MIETSRRFFIDRLKKEKKIFDEYKYVINPTSNLLLMGNLAFKNVVKAFQSDAYSFEEIAEQIKIFIWQADITENEKIEYVKFIEEIYPLQIAYNRKYGMEEFNFVNQTSNQVSTQRKPRVAKKGKGMVSYVENNDLFVKLVIHFQNKFNYYCQNHSQEEIDKTATDIGNKIKTMAGVEGLEGGAVFAEIENKIYESNYSNSKKDDVASFILRIIPTHAKAEDSSERNSNEPNMDL